MPFLVFFLIISLPVLEVASIVEVSRWVGPVATFLLLAAQAAFGASLIRSQSLAAGRRVMQAMQAGTPPERPLLDSGAIVLAGMLFMIPGFFSDILALFLLLPVARRLMWQGVSFGLSGEARTRPMRDRNKEQGPKPQRAEDVIDAEFTEVPPGRDPGNGHAHRNSPWGKST